MTRCESAGLGWTKLHICLDEYKSYLSRSLHYNHGYNHGYNHLIMGYNHGYNHTSWFLGIWNSGGVLPWSEASHQFAEAIHRKGDPFGWWQERVAGTWTVNSGRLQGDDMTVGYVWHAIWRCKMDLYGFVFSESWICWINCDFGEQLTLAWSDLIQDRQLSLPFWTARLTWGFDQV